MGGQVYIVCPAIEESENDAGEIGLDEIGIDPASAKKNEAAIPSRLKAVEEFSEELIRRFPQLNIGVIHGKMQSADKDAVMRDFADGKLHVLVSTTVIEVGVNVPNACLMIVENAERFGLSQLHQLRGRVGRGQRKSYCVLVSAAASGELKGTTAGKRLQSLCTLYDGYAIAEQDLLMRGPGDFFGKNDENSIRQSGGIRLKLAEQCDDSSLMSSAFAEANALVSRDPSLSQHPLLRAEISRMISGDNGIMN
jgi:ATP-dependent DNA helicase RecG